MYNVILHKNAAKFYKNADNKLKGRIKEAINNISGNPRLHVHIKKLEGELKHSGAIHQIIVTSYFPIS